jgi:hypothetical protein
MHLLELAVAVAVAMAVAAKALKPANTAAIQDRHISPELYL